MVEMMVALVIIAIVTTAALAFFINGLRSETGQRQRQEAIYLADQQMQTVQSVPAADLVQGRSSTMQNAALSNPVASTLNLAAQSDLTSSAGFDSNSSHATLIPLSQTQTLDKVNYTLWTFVYACHLKVSTNSQCGQTVPSGSTTELRATVAVTWTSNANCTSGCNYSTSTLVDPSGDQTFNTNISSPTGAISTPSSAAPALPTFFNSNTGTRGTTAYESCTTGATGNTVTVPGTLMVITGTGFKSNIRVLISSNGGSIPTNTIYQPSASEIDVCLQTADVPGTYTVSVINNDGGHFQTKLSEIPIIRWAALSGSGANQTLTLNGGGFANGATYTATGGVGGTFNWVSGTQVQLLNYVSPTAGLATAPVITVTDPAPGSQKATFSLPDLSATTFPASVAVTGPVSVSVTGVGFQPGLATTGVTNGTATATYTGPTNATVSLRAGVVGTMSFALLNPDGGVSNTITLTVDPQPTISPAPGSKLTGVPFNVTGTGFLTGITASISGGDGVTVNSSAAGTVSLTVNGTAYGLFTLTLTNVDGGTVSTPITILPPPAVTGRTTGVSGQIAVTLTGTNFQTGITVSDSNGTLVTATRNSATQLTLMLSDAAAAPFTHNLTLTNPDGGTTTTTAVVDPQLDITTVPASTTAGTQFTVGGTGFTPGLTITSTKAGTPTVTYVSSTSVLVTLPTSGSQTFTLTNPDGGNDTATVTPIPAPAPSITSFTVNPTTPARGSTPTITVVGANLSPTSTYVVRWVKSGSTTQQPTVTYSSRTATGAVFTNGPLGSTNGAWTVTVTVTNPDGQTASFAKSVSVS
jgi:Tfp pilus assembly protein PilV